jgi:hypothetical protein
MKIKILIAACSIVTIGTSAQTPVSFQMIATEKPSVCVDTKNGKHIIIRDGKIVTTEITLESGARVTSKGKVIWKDESSSMLRKGECISEQGTTFSPRQGSVNLNKPIRKPELDVVVNNYRGSFGKPNH